MRLRMSSFWLATEAGAEDFEATDEMFLITTDPASLYSVQEALITLALRANLPSWK